MSGKCLSANYSPGLAASKQLWAAHSSYQAPDSINSSFFYLFSLYLMKVEVSSIGTLGPFYFSPVFRAASRLMEETASWGGHINFAGGH